MKKLFLISATVLLSLSWANWAFMLFAIMFFIGYLAAKNEEFKSEMNGHFRKQLKRHVYEKKE